MAIYHVRVAVDVSTTAAEEVRAEYGLPPGAPILDAVRQEVWQAVSAVERWADVRVT